MPERVVHVDMGDKEYVAVNEKLVYGALKKNKKAMPPKVLAMLLGAALEATPFTLSLKGEIWWRHDDIECCLSGLQLARSESSVRKKFRKLVYKAPKHLCEVENGI